MNFSATLNKTLRHALPLLCALVFLVHALACTAEPPRITGRSVIRLTELFKRADKTVNKGKLSLESVLSRGAETLDGEKRQVIRQHPAGTLSYRLRVPRNAVLRFGYCMAPHTWRKSPDGIRFHVRAWRINSGGSRAAKPVALFSAALDTMNVPAHRRVFEQQVDLTPLGGAVWELTFNLSHGAGKDVNWDNGLWVDPRIEFPAGEIEAPKSDLARPDILLVTVDSLRADVLASTGAGGDPAPAIAAAPVINKLAFEGLRAAVAFTPSTLTIPSYASIITGAAPAGHGLRLEGRRKVPALPTAGMRFSEYGYRTAAFLGTSRLSARSTGLSRGFERYDCPATGRRSAEETVLGLLDWVRLEDGRPSFCWLQFNELHPPLAHLGERDRHFFPSGGYNRWEESILRLLPQFVRRPDLKEHWYRWLHDVTATGYVEASYLSLVNEVDRQLGWVIDELRTRNMLKNTVVVVTANHGLALGEQGIFYTSESLQPGVSRVPLIIRFPGRVPAASRFPDNAPCTTADILPTLLGLLPPAKNGGAHPAPAGMDLLAALRNISALESRVLLLEGHIGPPKFPNRYALLAGGYKLVESPGCPASEPGAGGFPPWSANAHYHNNELFNITVDPGERENLSGSRKLADLQHVMHNHLMSMIPK